MASTVAETMDCTGASDQAIERPAPATSLLSVAIEGCLEPLSYAAIADCVVAARSASCDCVNPARRRAALTMTAASTTQV